MSAKKDKIRLFVSIEVPKTIKEKIHNLTSELPADAIKAVPVENMHLTLKFIGEIKTKKLAEIEQNLRVVDFEPFELSFKGVGVFPSTDYVKVVWVGSENEQLQILAKKVEDALSGIVEKEKRGFSAHLTVARVRKKIDVMEFLQKHQDEEFGSFTVKQFNLMQSELAFGKSPKYTVVSEFEALK
jgi:2'-5' RNA ligase